MPSDRGRDQLRVTMLLYGDATTDARVRREAATLVEAGHAVTIATLSETSRAPYALDEARVVPLAPPRVGLMPGDPSPFRAQGPRPGRLRAWADRGRWLAGYAMTFLLWRRAGLRRLGPADVWHGHDLLGLLLAQALRKRHGGSLVHDSHELYLEAGSAARLPGPARRLLASLERRATRSADAVLTVNPAIAEELRRRYGVRPIVIMNCPVVRPLAGPRVLRDRLGLHGRRVAIHHGVLGPGRGIAQLITSLAFLPPDVAVVLLGDGPLAADLRRQAAEPALRGRLFVEPAVPLEEVRAWIGDADVGAIPFQPVDRNNVLGTPNKLFEYLEVGVPVVVSDFPELRRIVDETGAGLVVDPTDPHAIAAAITRLLDEPEDARMRRRSLARAAAEQTYGWQSQGARLTEVYDRLIRRTAVDA